MIAASITTKMVERLLTLVVLCLAGLLLPVTANAQSAPKMEGEWEVSYVRYDSPDSKWTNDSPAPVLAVFTKKYYSIVGVPEPNQPEDLIPFVGSAGTYEVSASKLVLNPTIRKNEAVGEGSLAYEPEIRVMNDNLFLTYAQGDGTVTVRLTRIN
jgi:hypothetical protein